MVRHDNFEAQPEGQVRLLKDGAGYGVNVEDHLEDKKRR
jgi:hypothetical protein